jgi:D-erythrulose 4-phosphate isomerase
MKVAIGGDSVGAPLVNVLLGHLNKQPGIEITDLSDPQDHTGECYAEMAARIAHRLLAGEFDRAILCCGTGLGMSISANKVPGIRAALTHDTYSAQRAALSNNAQIITMGARVIGPELAKSVADAWLGVVFDPNGASARNVAAINALDS